MRIQNSPAAYGWLAGMLVFIVGLLLADAGCAHYPPGVDTVRTEAQRAATAVEVRTNCGAGSGVLLDGKTVLTAFHVVNCAAFPAIKPPQAIVVRLLDKTALAVVRVSAQPAYDLAKLTLEREAPGVPPVSVRRARVGETVCAYTSTPDRYTRCGRVDAYPEPREQGDVHVKDADYWYGNSGSGVYSQNGQLVGLVVRLNWCSLGDALLFGLSAVKPEHTCGGQVSSLTDSTVLP